MKSSSWTDTLHCKRESKEKIEWKEHAVQCLQHVARKQEESNLGFCEDFTELSICSSSPSSDTMPLRLLGVTTSAPGTSPKCPSAVTAVEDILKGQSTWLKSVYNYLYLYMPVLFHLTKVLKLGPLKLLYPSLSKKEK